jgi:UDP-N-acetylmuramyl pentapeptide synthase
MGDIRYMKTAVKRLIERILFLEARLILARHKPRIIAITGNVGKTSTKDAIYTAIKGSVRARKSEKSFNSDVGVPLTVLGLTSGGVNPLLWMMTLLEGLFIALFSRQYPAWLVLEMGVDTPGDMKRLTKLAQPTIAVLTRFPEVPVHVEFFQTPEAVMEEKMELARALKEGGTLLFNNDDEHIRKRIEDLSCEKIGFGSEQVAPYHIHGGEVRFDKEQPSGYRFQITHGVDTVAIESQGTIGMHTALAYAAACAVAGVLSIPLTTAARALEQHTPAPGRMRLIRGIKDSTIIDDTYNASPLAVEEGITLLQSLTSMPRRVAILGDMLELGRFSVREHEKIGRMLGTHIDALVVVGVRARAIAESAHESGFRATRILALQDATEAAATAPKLIKKGDLVYVKGSQGMRMERVVKALMQNPESAGDLLVRQDPPWQD